MQWSINANVSLMSLRAKRCTSLLECSTVAFHQSFSSITPLFFQLSLKAVLYLKHVRVRPIYSVIYHSPRGTGLAGRLGCSPERGVLGPRTRLHTVLLTFGTKEVHRDGPVLLGYAARTGSLYAITKATGSFVRETSMQKRSYQWRSLIFIIEKLQHE